MGSAVTGTYFIFNMQAWEPRRHLQARFPFFVSPHYYILWPSVVAVFFAPLAYAASRLTGILKCGRGRLCSMARKVDQ